MNAKMQIEQLLSQLSRTDKLSLIEEIVRSIQLTDTKSPVKKSSKKEHPVLEMAGIWSEKTAAEMEEHLLDARRVTTNHLTLSK